MLLRARRASLDKEGERSWTKVVHPKTQRGRGNRDEVGRRWLRGIIYQGEQRRVDFVDIWQS